LHNTVAKDVVQQNHKTSTELTERDTLMSSKRSVISPSCCSCRLCNSAAHNRFYAKFCL